MLHAPTYAGGRALELVSRPLMGGQVPDHETQAHERDQFDGEGRQPQVCPPCDQVLAGEHGARDDAERDDADQRHQNPDPVGGVEQDHRVFLEPSLDAILGTVGLDQPDGAERLLQAGRHVGRRGPGCQRLRAHARHGPLRPSERRRHHGQHDESDPGT